MARVPDLKRIVKEDFASEYRELIERLAFPLNSHMEQVRSALSKNINFENLSQELKVLSFTTGSDGQPLSTLSFASSLSSNVQGFQTLRVVVTSDNTSFASQVPLFSWTQEANLVTIQNIGGLEAEKGYQVTILTL